MNIEELITMVESVLEMNEQADRSTALDIIREEIYGMNTRLEHQVEEIQNLTETKDKLTARNNELFIRIDGAKPDEVEEIEEVGTEIYDDVEIFD